MKLRLRLLAALVALTALAPLARAHQSSVVYSTIVARGRTVEYTFQLSSTDLYEAVGVSRDRPVTRDEVRAGKGRLLAYLAERVHVAAGGADCPAAPTSQLDFADNADGFFAQVGIDYQCPRTVAEATVRYDLFFDVDPRHQG